jgi:PBS lyase HEAT-like repeat
MNTTTYPSPVDKLLTIGEPNPAGAQDWPNYLELGLGPEHIPDLLRMLADNELFDPELLKEGAEKPEGWAPHHAMRALGQLRDVSAVEPLLSQSDRLIDYDEGLGEWGMEELPEVYGLIGPAAIPALTAYIADKSHGLDSRTNAATGLEKIAEMHPEAREEIVAALTRQLESAQENDPRLNAFIIDNLINLQAVEAAPVIERALATDSVDMDIVGDWDDVQAALGLKPRQELPPPPTIDILSQTPILENVTTPSSSPSTTLHKRVTAQKTKHKMAKQSRKKNRRKK